jgi:hypothetical protein
VGKPTVAKMRSEVVLKLEVGPVSPHVLAKMFVLTGAMKVSTNRS